MSSPERVEYFLDLHRAKVKLPRMWVAPVEGEPDHYHVIDGRHRLEMFKREAVADVPVEIWEGYETAELIAIAMEANYTSGPMQMTEEDLRYDVRMMKEQGWSKTHIRKRLAQMNKWPESMIVDWLADVERSEHKAQVRRAVEDVRNGDLTVQAAAMKRGVKVSEVQDAIKRSPNSKSLEGWKNGITMRYRGQSKRNNTLCKSLRDEYQKGRIGAEQVREMYDHIERQIETHQRALRDQLRRFEQLSRIEGQNLDFAPVSAEPSLFEELAK